MFGKFGSLLSFRGHLLGRDGATPKRRPARPEQWDVGQIAEPLEPRLLLTLTAGTDVNVTHVGGSQAEVSVAVNPTNPLNLIAVANGGQNNGDEQFLAYTLDGGQNWIQNPLTGQNDGINDPSGSDRFDAAVAFDAFGNAHLIYMAREFSTGESAMIYATSSNGGITFSTRTVEPLSGFNDKPWVATGPDAADLNRQVVLLTYQSDSGLVAKAAPVSGLGVVGAFSSNSIYSQLGNYGVPTVGPNGEFAITWQNPAGGQGPGSVLFTRDTNGLVGGITFGGATTITSTNAGGFDFIPATPDRSAFASPYLAYDQSTGTHRGRLYVAYADETVNENDNFEIFVRFSDNNGQTWSPRIRVNDDVGTNSQFFQSISVDPATGAIFMGWYDARNDLGDGNGADTDNVANTDVEYFGSVSTDGGLTWEPNVRISDGSSNQVRDVLDPGNDFGDYTGVAAYGGTGYAVWGDNSNSTGDNPGGTTTLDMYFDSVRFNSAPTLTFTPDITVTGVTIDEDTSTGPLDFTVTDDNTAAASLIVTAVSSDQAIIPDGNLSISGTGAAKTINATPVANVSGVVTITVTVSDGLLTDTKSFQVLVLPTPDPLPVPPDATDADWSFADNTSTPITDNAQTTSTITVSTLPDTYLYDANITVNISHTRNSDLKVVLISPQGTQVVLTSNNGGDFDNVFAGTLFDDQAVTTPVTDYPFADAVVASYVVPEGALAQLLGEDPNGDWTLQIDDVLAGETGTLNGWQLDLKTLSTPPLLQANFGINGQSVSVQDARIVNSTLVPGVTESTINMNGLDFFTLDVDLSVDISHGNSGDLILYLISPSGTIVPISTRNGGAFDNIYRNTTFNDQALAPVTDVTYANNVPLSSVIPEAALSGFVGENPNGNWKLRIVDNAVTGTGTLLSWSLNVSTQFINDPPTIGTIINPGAVPEDSGEQSVTLNSITAGGGEIQPLQITVSSNNPGLLSNLSVDYTSGSPNGTVLYTPAPNQFGVALVTVTVEDGGYDQNLGTTGDNGTTTKTFTIVVNPVNDAPTIDQIADPAPILEDAGHQQLILTGISAGGGESQPLQIIATSKFPVVISNLSVEYVQGANTAILHYQSNLNYNGIAPLTVLVTDGGLDGDLSTTNDNVTTTRTFTVEIIPVNDAPTLDAITNPTPVSEDSPTQTIGLSGITPGGQESQPMRITAVSSDLTVVSDVSVNYVSANSVGSLSFRGAPNGFGTATITVTVEDGGEDALLSTPGDNAFFQRQFIVTVLEINDAPVFSVPNLAPLTEDPPLQKLNLTGVSAGPFESQPLAFTVSSSNPALIPTPTITYASPDSEGELQFNVTPNMSGGSVITITLTDGGLDNNLATTGDNQSFTRNLVITVLPFNDLPTLDNIANPLPLDEDTGTQTIPLTGISAGGNENQPLQIVAVSNFPSIIPDPVITYTSPNSTGTLEFTPDPDQWGTVTISVIVTDGGLDGNLATTGDNGVTTKTFVVTINPVNDAPHFDHIPDPPAILEDSGLDSFIFGGVTAGANESEDLQFTAVSTDPTILPDPVVGYIQRSSEASLQFQPVPGRNGSVTITVTVTDPGLDGDFSTLGDNLSYSQDFVMTVIPVNDPPTISAITPPDDILEDAGQQTVNLSGLSSGDPGQVFQITATSSNTALLPNGNFVVNHTGSNATGTLGYTTALNQFGTTTVTVTITDGGNDNDLSTTADNLSNSTTFNVTVLSANDVPTLDSLGGTYDLTEDAGLQVVQLTGITAGGGESQPLLVTVQSLNPALIPNPVINYTSPNATGQLVFAPLANQAGSATLRIRVEDGGPDNNLATTLDNLFITQDLVVNVAQANDAPTIDPFVAPQVVLEDVGPVGVTLTGISGGIGEVQNVTITAVSDDPSVVPDPVINYTQGQATGTLTFTPVANQSGTANITITIEDAGGLQTVRVLTVIVTPVNDASTINSLGGPVTIAEDSLTQTVNLSGISAGPNEGGQVFNISVTSDHPEIIPNPTLIYTPGSTTGQLTYQPLPDANGQVVLTVRIVDGGADNNLATTGDNATTLATLTVNVAPESEVPVLVIDQGTLPTRAGRKTLVTPAAQLSDADSENYKNGSLTVRIIAGAQSGDSLRLKPVGKGPNRLHATKQGQLKRGKTVIGTVTGGQGAVPLHFNFATDISQSEVEQIIRSVEYSGAGAQTGPRTVEISVTDPDSLTSDPVTRLIALT